MSSGSYDFTGYEVLVVGGHAARGTRSPPPSPGPARRVTVTGTMMLRALYDTDLSQFDYESVNLPARSDRQPGRRDRPHRRARARRVVPTCRSACRPASGRSSPRRPAPALLGPTFLTTRLRLKLSQSPAPGGSCVINTGAVSKWLELSATAGGGAGPARRVDGARRRAVGGPRRPGQLRAAAPARGAPPPVRPSGGVERSAAGSPATPSSAPSGSARRWPRPPCSSPARGASRVTGQTLRLS